MKKHPELVEADDFAEVVADDIFEADSGIFETKYKDYTSKDIDGKNYREELTTLPDVSGITQKIKKLEKAEEVLTEKMRPYGEIDGEFDFFKSLEADKNPEHKALSEQAKKIREEIKALKAESGNDVSYKSSHWDESNVLYHVRKQDTKIDGDDTMLIEEIQSDWHQEGRKKGYKTEFTKQEETIWKDYENIWEGISNDEIDLTGISGHTNMDKALELTAKKHNISIEEVKNITKFKENGVVPQAPYSKTWHEKAMNDQIAEAVETGKDRVAWIAGKEQADRYSLSKQVKSIQYEKLDDGKYSILAKEHNNGTALDKIMSEKELSDTLGKDMADKIISSERKSDILVGQNLEVGGEGMKGFYDQMLPKWTDKYIKKYGSKVEVKKLANGQEVWSFKVTDKMKKELKGKGQALYSGAAGVGIAASQQEDNK